jgi:hypothetical protein
MRLVQEYLGAAYAGLVSRKSTCAVEPCPVGCRVFQAAVLSSFGLLDRNPTPPAFTMPAAARASQRGA